MFGLEYIVSPITSLVVMLYAPLMSYHAIKGHFGEAGSEKSWLLFWVIWSVLNTVEKFTFNVLEIIPVYYELKAGLVIYLMFFGGSQLVFDKVVDPAFAFLDKKIPRDQLEAFQKDPQGYLKEKGPKAFAAAKAEAEAVKAKMSKDKPAAGKK